MAATARKDSLISVRAYARHRGCDQKTVRDAVKSGRLAACIVMVPGRKGALEAKIADVAAADREWDEHTRPREVAVSPAAGAYNTARAAREHENAELQRIKREQAALALAQAKGELVPAADVRAAVVEKFTVVRTKLLALPSRAKQQLPHLSVADVAAIDALVRESLEELADGSA